MCQGLRDPMQLATLAVALRRAVEEMGFRVTVSDDFKAFAEVRARCRGGKVAPFFDPAVNAGLDQRGFWVGAEDASGKPICIQAFRIDTAEPSLADWAPGFIMGLYLKRGELLVPTAVAPPMSSVTERVCGRVVYHGELWIDPEVRQLGLLDTAPRMGMFLAMIKWQPDAIWAIVGQSMATRGQVTRIGYSHLERGFLQWEFLPEGGEGIEWLAICERPDLEYLVQQTRIATTNGPDGKA